jgi:hypothetical protein
MGRIGRRWRTLAGGVSGLVFGTAGGIAGIVLLAGGASGGAREAGDSFITAAHVPPLLTLPGEDVRLRYALVCPPPAGDASPGACDGSGDVFIRVGRSGPFERLALTRGADSAEGRYFVDVPRRIASAADGFSYYAVLRDRAHGAELTIPAGGTDAPQESLPLRRPVTVKLGEHVFGETRRRDARVLDARWGSAVGQAGLSGGPTTARMGPSSFDVARDGTVVLLDELNGRIQRWRGEGLVGTVRVDVPAATDDLAVAPDGAMYVLDGRSAPGQTPLVRTFSPDGTLRRARHIAERTWSQLRMGPGGPLVHQEPSEQWMPVADGSTPLDRTAQARAGRAGRLLADGSQLVVLRSGIGEVRLARVAGGSVRVCWRVISATPLGEVQLVDALGSRIVLVVKAYTEREDEFEVLVLDGRGLVKRFAVASDQWADAAPLAHFRLAGSALYKLGSTPTGVFVDRYDLEGAR